MEFLSMEVLVIQEWEPTVNKLDARLVIALTLEVDQKWMIVQVISVTLNCADQCIIVDLSMK